MARPGGRCARANKPPRPLRGRGWGEGSSLVGDAGDENMMQNQVVVVTGAARGIGRYIAHTFAEAGANLVVADIDSLDNVSRELRKLEAEALAVNTNVRD